MKDPFIQLYQPYKIPGSSSPESTKNYFYSRFPEKNLCFSILDGIHISKLGFGCYRVSRGYEIHKNSLKKAILSGINLIDTSSNYGDGSSEALVGDVLRELTEEGLIKREEIFIVTKAGYIQGKNLIYANYKEETNHPFTDIVYLEDNLWHCIHPDFLEEELERSLNRLGLECIDAFLLHNPEYFLIDSEKHNANPETAKEKYYKRISLAFEFLENSRKKGLIKYYGISSNTFVSPENSYIHTSLDITHQISKSISKMHNSSEPGFKFAQFPANLYETGFITEKNNRGMSVSEYANSTEMFTLSNRPLNAASKHGGMEKLSMLSSKQMEIYTKSFDCYYLKLKEFELEIFKTAGIENEETYFSEILDKQKDKFKSIHHLHFTLDRYIIPTVKKTITRLNNLQVKEQIVDKYVDLLNRGVQELEHYVLVSLSRKISYLNKTLNKLSNQLSGKSLSQQAVLSLLSFPGINSVLVGMKKEEYVTEMLETLNLEFPKLQEDDLRDIEE